MTDLRNREWDTTTLDAAMGSLVGGGTPSRTKKEYWGGEIPWATVKDLLGKQLSSTQETITRQGLENSSATLVPSGVLILATRMAVGRVAKTTREIAINQDLKAITAAKTVDIDFLQQWFMSCEATLNSLSSGSTVRGLTIEALKSIPIELPPLAEQKKIAEILSSVDEVIENTESEINKLEDLKKATLNELLTKGIGHTEFKETEIGRIPKSWKINSVEELFVIGRGRVISGQYLKAHSGPYPVYSSQSKNDGVFGFIDSYDFDGEHITWTTDGAYAGTVFYRSGKFNCTNVCGILTSRSPQKISEQFAAYYLASVAKKHVSYVGNPKLMNNVFSQIPLVVPPLEEQLKISEAIASIQERITVSQMQLHNLSSLKNALMQDLLTGKVRVKVN